MALWVDESCSGLTPQNDTLFYKAKWIMINKAFRVKFNRNQKHFITSIVLESGKTVALTAGFVPSSLFGDNGTRVHLSFYSLVKTLSEGYTIQVILLCSLQRKITDLCFSRLYHFDCIHFISIKFVRHDFYFCLHKTG